MLAPGTIQSLDQLLNELEELAHSEIAAAKFWAVLTEQLGCLTSALGVVVLLPTDSAWQSTLTLGQSGHVDGQCIQQLSARLQPTEATDALASRVMAEASSQPFWCAVPVRGQPWRTGAILLTLPQMPAQESRHALFELMSAFAEIASLKQLLDVERFLDGRWPALQETLARMATTESVSEMAVALANHLKPILAADRVSVALPGVLSGVEVIAVSGVSQIDSGTDTVRALHQIAYDANQQGQPLLRHGASRQNEPSAAATGTTLPPAHAQSSLDEAGLFHNLLAFRLASSRRAARHMAILIVEWASYQPMISALPVLNQLQPLIGHSWEMQRRWLRIPGWFRALWDWNTHLPNWSLRLLRWGIVAIVCLAVYRTLTLDTRLTIEAPAYLEPVVKRSIFATADGYVEALLVEDGQEIAAGTVVAKLRSPALDLQIEELHGQLRSLAERLAGVRVALNQIDAATRDAAVQQSRLSADITQINTQESNLQNQLKLLDEERRKLELVAPISGAVVARDLKQQLLHRPVQRGDVLFTVVDLQGAWHLRIEVPDRDSGYVRAQLTQSAHSSPPTDEAQHKSIDLEYILDSLPEKRFTAPIYWQSDIVQNRAGEGCYWEVRAHVDRSVVDQSHMGAGALAYFRCGTAPLWFVWCRPLVETAQRKFWILSEGESHDVP